MAKVAALFALHEFQRRAEAAGGAELGNRFLQHKLRPQIKSFMCCGFAIQNGEGHRIPVAGALAQVPQHIEASLEVVTVHDDRVKLLRQEDFAARTCATANFNFDG